MGALNSSLFVQAPVLLFVLLIAVVTASNLEPFWIVSNHLIFYFPAGLGFFSVLFVDSRHSCALLFL